MTVVSVSELTGLILVTDANSGLDSIMWIAKFNEESATDYITIASAHDSLTTNGLYYFQWIFLDCFSYIEHQYHEYQCDG